VDGSSCAVTVVSSPETRQRYTLTHLHARGGLGEVWVARDDSIGREVALKELRPERAGDPAVWRRFVEEARITGQLEHPNIVPVYELAQRGDDQQPFYTMRFIKGRTLSEAVHAYHGKREAGQAGPLDLRELLGCFVSVCHAVAYAHSRGVIHRDLKGQNVVLGDFGEVVVLDWGLAKVLNHRDEQGRLSPLSLLPRTGENPTLQGQVLGTPAYMAPEQARGRLDEIEPRTDVYSLGAVLYEILTGQPPFSGDDSLQVLARVVGEPPVPPRTLLPTVPRALEAVSLKALAKHPEERYASARELAQEVQQWLADEPVQAYPEPWTVRARRWLGRHRTLAASTAAALLAATLILAAATGLLKAANEREQRSRARAEDNYKLARDAVDRYFTKLSDSPQLRAHGLEKLRRDLLQDARTFYERFLAEQGDAPELQAERAKAYGRLAKITAEIGTTAEALEFSRKAQELFEQLIRDHPDVREHRHNLAIVFQDRGAVYSNRRELSLAEQTYLQALTIRQQLVADHPDVGLFQEEQVRVTIDLGNIYRDTGRLDRAGESYEQALKVVEPLIEKHDSEPLYRFLAAGVYYNLGRMYRLGKQPEQAQPAYEKGLANLRHIHQADPDNPTYQHRLGGTLSELGLLYLQTRKIDKAREAYKEALTINERLAHDHPGVRAYRELCARNYNDLGLLFKNTNNLTEARAHYEKALGHFKELSAMDPKMGLYQDAVAGITGNIAILYKQTRQPALAREKFEEALLLREALVKAHPEVTELQKSLDAIRLEYAGTLAMLGEHARAVQDAASLLEKSRDAESLLYDAACVYSLASAAAAKDAKLPPPEQGKMAQQYAARSVELLRQAVDKGYTDIKHIKEDTDLDPIRRREDFQKVLQELEARLKAQGK
jgi:serine/threonine-protein kinase